MKALKQLGRHQGDLDQNLLREYVQLTVL